jgi:serine-type D-Ala-D-Ala carboxypeptidase (penicillin-binding protein 5/6)
MSKKINRLIIFLFVFYAAFIGLAEARKGYCVTCDSAIFSNSSTGTRLYGKDVDQRVYPASTTKVMTALLVMERLSLDQYVTVNPSAINVQPSIIAVRPGERYTVRDLLYAILLNSANDASIVLAEAVAGSENNFVQLMNQRARQIGAGHTQFANSNGLPSGRQAQYTTAYDMYLIFRQALKYPLFEQIMRTKIKAIYSQGGRKIYLRNHNKLLFKGWDREIFGKTGYTRSARSCFIGALQHKGHTYIIGVFGCNKRWTDIKHIVSRYGRISL